MCQIAILDESFFGNSEERKTAAIAAALGVESCWFNWVAEISSELVSIANNREITRSLSATETVLLHVS